MYFSGAHIPQISSAEGFFDILHLGVFLILSPAFDKHFYENLSPPPWLEKELNYALRHFFSILHTVRERFHILLDGVGVSVKYVLDRMVAEFAAAAAFLGKNLPGDQVADDVDCTVFIERLEGILRESHPEVFGFFSSCLDHGHKYFVWTGPELTMLPRTEEVVDLFPIAELLDLPTYSIYDVVLDATPAPGSAPSIPKPPTKPKPHAGKRPELEEESDRARKRTKRR